MSLLAPALQKFYSALKGLERFSTENSFFDNTSSIDTFLSEFRSVTFALQTSLGTKDHPDYIKNRDAILAKDPIILKWLNDQRVTIIHQHPFNLKKILRVVVYDSGKAVVFKKYEQNVEQNEPFGDYLQVVRNSFLAIQTPEIYFSAQYLFVEQEDLKERSIFEFIDSGILSMWKFLHTMKVDLKDDSKIANKLMAEIDGIVQLMPQRWMLDVVDYCYYKTDVSFDKGESFTFMQPDIPMLVAPFVEEVQKMSTTVKDLYDAFIYLHTCIYVQQKHHIMSTFFIEYEDGTYRMISFLATIRTTMYRYINRVAHMVDEGNVINVYLVTETVGYGGFGINAISKFMQLNYKEKMAYRTKTFLSFYKVNQIGGIKSAVMDADALVDRLSVSVAIGNMKSSEEFSVYNVMLTPVVESFKKKLFAIS